MIEETEIKFKKQGILESLEEILIDCEDVQNFVSITKELNFLLEEYQATEKEDIRKKISEQRTIVESTQRNVELIIKKISYIVNEILKEKAK